MKKVFLAAFLAILIPSLYSCSAFLGPKDVTLYSPYSPFRYNFVTEDMIRDGEKLRGEYPDEDFLYNKQTITYTFDVDEKLLLKEDKKSTKSRRSKRKKKRTKTLYRSSSQVITVTESNLQRTIDKFNEDLDKSDWQKSGVTVTEKNEIEVLALDDRLNYEHAIFYTDAESVSGITGKYADDDNTSFILPTYTKNYESNGIFHDDAKMAYTSVPMYVVGNTLSLEYTKEYNDYRYLSSIYFPDNHRIKEKTITIEIPEGLDVELIEMNFEGYDITRTEGKLPEVKEEKTSRKKSRKKRKKRNRRKSRKKRSSSKSKNIKTIHYTLKNFRAMKSEYANYGSSHSVPHLLVMCKSYTGKKDSVSLMGSGTAALYKWYSTLANKMENEPDKIAAIAKDIVRGKVTDEEKISAVFYWVQDNIRYLAFEDGVAAFKPDECQNVYSKRYGDCKGMANLTKEMLKSLRYDARLTWIGTSRIAYDGTTPSLSSANHMICAVYLDSDKTKPYFLDATESYVSFGDYADRIQGRKVIIEDGDSFIIDSVPVYNYDHNKIAKTEQYTVDGKLLKGKVKKVYNGESKTSILSSYNSVKTDSRERALRTFLSQNNFNLSVADIQHSDFSERNKPFEINYTLNVKNRILTDDDKIYINPEWERDWANYRIDTNRYSHYSFRYKKHTERKVSIAIPQGYKVESLPQPVEIVTDEYIFRLNYKKQGNEVVYTKEIIMPKGYLHRSNIKEWNAAITQVSNFYDKYLVLTK